MSTPTTFETMRVEFSDDELLAVQYATPQIEHDLDEQADAERERYDEQILAALVAPSF